jgi:glutathione S-transferase
MILHDFELSGECYKVRLFLAILGLDCERRIVEIHPGDATATEAFRRLNPMGDLPVLECDGQVFRDPQAILTYLALAKDPTGRWFPVADPFRAGQTAQWLGFAAELPPTIGAARLAETMMADGIDVDAARAKAHRLLRVLDEHLWFQERAAAGWLADGADPTIADIAVFPHVILSEDGGIPRIDYPAVRRWCDRVKRIPGFRVMSGVFPTSPAAPA